MTAPLAPDRLALLRAAEYLETNGWRRGAGIIGKPLCILSALVVSINTEQSEVYPNALYLLKDHLRCDNVVRWNDAPDRTQNQVITALRAAAMEGL